MLHQDRAGSSFGVSIRAYGPTSLTSTSRCYAEAGASPSSEALPEEPPEAIGRRRFSTKRGLRSQSGGALGNRTVQRVLVL
jgi:hypothetical protein